MALDYFNLLNYFSLKINVKGTIKVDLPSPPSKVGLVYIHYVHMYAYVLICVCKHHSVRKH